MSNAAKSTTPVTLKQKLKRKLGREPWLDELESVRAAKRAKAIEDESWLAKSVAAFCLQQVGEGEEADDADEGKWKSYFNRRYLSYKDIENDDESDEAVKASAWKAAKKLLKKEAFAQLDWAKQLSISTSEVDDGGGELRELDASATLYSPFAKTRAVSLHLHMWNKCRAYSCEFNFSLEYVLHGFEAGVKEKPKPLCSTYFMDCPDDGMADESWSPVENVKVAGFTSAAVQRIHSHLLGNADVACTQYDIMHLLLAATGAFDVDHGAIPLEHQLKKATGSLSAAERKAHKPYSVEAAKCEWGQDVLSCAKDKAEEAYEDFQQMNGGGFDDEDEDEDGEEEDEDEDGECAEWKAFWKEMAALEEDPVRVWACAESGSLPWSGKRWARGRDDRFW